MITVADYRLSSQRFSSWVERYDILLLGSAIALVILGLVMVTSASITMADRNYHEPLHFLWRQLFAVVIGVGIAGLMLRIPLAVWEHYGRPLLVLTIVMLILVLLPGISKTVNGSTRWLKLGPISLQASEPVKLFVIIYLSGYLVRFQQQLQTTLIGLIKPVLVMAVIAMLLLLEPDFGVTVVLFSTALGMLFMGGVALKRFAPWMFAAVALLGGIAVMAPYRMRRLLSFTDPWADPYNQGFQLTQALIAFGRGEWSGVGLGGSVQKLFYLPEAHTDFILAVLAEELGLMGTLTVITLFGFIVWRAFLIGRRAEQAGLAFAAFLAFGIGLLLGLEAFINVGVNMGVLPTKGLALPFISYGSNSMVVSCVAIGLLLRVEYETRRAEEQNAYAA